MPDIATMLDRWAVKPRHAREQMYQAPMPREREREHALWLLAQE